MALLHTHWRLRIRRQLHTSPIKMSRSNDEQTFGEHKSLIQNPIKCEAISCAASATAERAPRRLRHGSARFTPPIDGPPSEQPRRAARDAGTSS